MCVLVCGARIAFEPLLNSLAVCFIFPLRASTSMASLGMTRCSQILSVCDGIFRISTRGNFLLADLNMQTDFVDRKVYEDSKFSKTSARLSPAEVSDCH